MSSGAANPRSRVCVVACCDQRMLPAACVALLTAREHLGGQSVSFCLVGQNLEPNDIAKFHSFCTRHKLNIELLNFAGSQNAGKAAHVGGLTTATFLRLHLDQLLPPDLDRVLYLDSDIIVTNDISELVTCDLGTYDLAAVPDVFNTSMVAKRHFQDIGLPPASTYFNAGVLVFNWPQIRQNGLLAKARQMAGQRADYRYHDQDILNILCDRSWKKLDVRFNASIHVISAGRPVAIAHFNGIEKPWKSRCYYRHSVYRKIYQSVLAKSEWPDFVEKIKFHHRLLWIYEPVMWFIQRTQGWALT